MLALLLLHPNEVLSSERLIDELWGEAPPATAAKALQAHVSRLRKALAVAADAGPDGPIVTRGHGYLLQVGPDQLDSQRFERLLREAQGTLAEGRAEHAVSLLEEALTLWRGTPLADLAYEPFAQAEVARLEDLRIAALEQLVEAKLALGRHVEVIGELEALIDEHPYRERLRAQLMLALYRSDRQADALQAYQNARTRLVEELGIEPGERLRALESAILAQDPALAQPAPPPAPEPEEEPVPPAEDEDTLAELPSGVVTFLLTDIEGSSGLWEADFDAMAVALELHDALIAHTTETHGGRLLKTKGEGDSTLTVFRRASDAVAAAAELRSRLAEAAWPAELEPRVRIAVHTGEAHERDGDYFGPALNRAARLRALAQEGAVLLSQATAQIVHERLPAGTELIDIGRRELRGLSRPEQVFELRVHIRRRAAGDGGDPQDGDGAVRLRARPDAPGRGPRRRGAPTRQRARARRHASRAGEPRRRGGGLPGRGADGRLRRAPAARGRCGPGGACGGGAARAAREPWRRVRPSPGAQAGCSRGHRHRRGDRRGRGRWAAGGERRRGECGEAARGAGRGRRDPARRGHRPARPGLCGDGGCGSEPCAAAPGTPAGRRPPARTRLPARRARPAAGGAVEGVRGGGCRPHVPSRHGARRGRCRQVTPGR